MSREYNEKNIIKSDTAAGGANGQLDIARLIDDAFKGLTRYWVHFLVIVSVCSSLFYFQAKKNYVPMYYADSTFIVNTTTALNYSTSYYNKTAAEQMAKTFPYIIMNDTLQHIIEDDLGVSSIPGKITATAMEGTNMITIAVNAYTAEDAYNILQSVIRNYPAVAESVIGETELIIIDESGMPLIPMNSDGALSNAKKGFVAGAALCCFFLALYALTRKTIRREDDFSSMLNVRCLSCIPKVKFKKRSNVEMNKILIDNPNISYGFIEMNRTLRTRIEKDAMENGSKIYLVSSALAQEGKSTVAANVALSLATKGKKVILMDMDLRNPSARKTFGLETGEKGIIDVLRGKAKVQDIMVSYQDTALSILPGGDPIQNVGKILNGTAIGALCDSLRKEADYIIVDTPPSSVLTDAAQMVKHVDAGIFVVRQDYAPLDSILDGIEMLTDTGLRMLGCILNRAESGITGYGHGYGYGYSSYGKYGKYGKYGSKYASKYVKRPSDEDED